MLQDGSIQGSLQIVADPSNLLPDLVANITTGASLLVQGILCASQGKKQGKELQASLITLLGKAPAATYPIQPKHHTLSFLRGIQHLRFRTNTFGAVFRLRHAVSYAIHQFFHEKGFLNLHTPIITSMDAEGAGELFTVNSGKQPSSSPFFGKPTYLTVSGQLAAEAGALALGKVYTFGPTFRAENSNTTRHLSEFWMIEAEMAFYDLKDCIRLAEELLQHLFSHVLTHCPDEVAFLEKQALAANTGLSTSLSLRKHLDSLGAQPFVHITYDEAIKLLKKESRLHPHLFSHPVHTWGGDLQTEHERYLATTYFKRPVVVTDYPGAIKPFYMRENKDGKTVAAMDILLPNIGEIVGGSQREERYEKLLQVMHHRGLDTDLMEWYMDTRRFGTVVHSGFGLGLARLLQVITGMENLRDVIPFPRVPGLAAC